MVNVEPAQREALERLSGVLGSRAVADHPLGALTTYRVGGPAALYVEARSEADLLLVRRALQAASVPVPVLVLGKGSNMLVSDAGFPGLVVRLGAGCSTIAVERGAAGGAGRTGPDAQGPISVRAGGGAGLPVLARRTVDAGLSGMEWAVGIPGSVGGALRMNAGGHGADTASRLLSYRWLDLAGEAGGDDEPGRLAFGYRSSSLRSTEVVVSATFALEPGDLRSGREALARIVRWRREHQPGGSNAGSVFANPPGDSAGRLVEEAGLKGLRIGSAQVSPKHANFIQADGAGSADDVKRLLDHVRRVVAERVGTTLRTEVRLVGFEMAENGSGATEPTSLPDGEP